MNFAQVHIKAFRAEWLKLKRSGIFWLCLGASLFIPLLNTIVYFFIDFSEFRPVSNRWNGFIESNLTGFTGFFFPIFLVLMVVRLVYLEHRSDTWKIMETQPVAKSALYFSKWEVATLISLGCLILLLLFTLLGGLLLQIVNTKQEWSKHAIDWPLTIGVLFRYWISSLGIITILYFLALLIKSFAWPMGIGLMGTITGSIFAGFGILSWWPFSATALTSASYKGSITGQFLMQHEKMSLLWTALLLWMGFTYFKRKTFTRAFLKPFQTALLSSILVALFIAATIWITRPHTLDAYHQTVISGEFHSAKPVKNVWLIDGASSDTLLNLPVNNGKFHKVLTAGIPPGLYILRSGTYATRLFFGKGDSLHVSWDVNPKSEDVRLTGNRVAENKYLGESNLRKYWELTEFAYNYKPREYAGQLISTLKAELKALKNFKTAENIRLGDDFIATQTKLLKLRLIDLADNTYPRVHAIYYPNDTLKYPPSIDKLRSEVSITDASLISYPEYKDYVSNVVFSKSGNDHFRFLSQADSILQPGIIKDVVIFGSAQNNFFRVRDTLLRRALFESALTRINNPHLKNKLFEFHDRLQKMKRGNKAHVFSAEMLNGNPFRLNMLSGRYVILDVWATWCAPCKQEAPFFEDFAKDYTSESVAFVSVSIDEDKHAWRRDVAATSTKVLQLWSPNSEEDFANKYAVITIPRYILIDPRGMILHAEMPPPSDPEFEKILYREISTLKNRGYASILP